MACISNYNEMLSLENLYEYLEYKTKQFANSFAVQEYRDGRIFSHTYQDLLNDAKKFGDYLISGGVYKKQVSLIGGFSYEWLVSFFAVLYSNNVVVPIDGNQPSERIRFLLDTAQAEAVIAHREALSQDIVSSGKRILYYEDIDKVTAFETARDIKNFPPPTRNDTAMMIFTSGTTGVSKGVLLSHCNILHNVIGTIAHMGEDTFPSNENTIAVLPLFHIFGVTAGILLVLYRGVALCYSKNTIKDIEALLKTFKPIGIMAVPQVVEGLYKKIWAVAKKTGKQEALKRALKLSRMLRKIKIDLRKILFKKVLDSLGGKFSIIICGGAAIDEAIVEEMDELGILMLVGYGITECAPIVSINQPGKQKFDSVGVPLSEPFCRVKIKEGEILVKGSIVMSGYYDDPQATEEAFDDDLWFKTGDLGRIDGDGYLYITGRKKNLIILNDGNNISPEELEIRISQSPIVDSVLVYEEKRNKASVLLASVFPDFSYCRANGLSDIKREVMELIRQINAENPIYMKISDAEIRDLPFEKTSTGKIKRYAFMQKEQEALAHH